MDVPTKHLSNGSNPKVETREDPLLIKKKKKKESTVRNVHYTHVLLGNFMSFFLYLIDI